MNISRACEEKGRARVILVDDEPMALESIGKGTKWEEAGAALCAVFTDGQRALEYVRNNPVDIVVTDINMASFNGLELCAYLRELRPDIQFIIISGHADFSYAQKAMHFGAVGYCLKPVDYEQLNGYVRYAVRRLLKEKSRQPQMDMMEALCENDMERVNELLRQGGVRVPFYVAVSTGSVCLEEVFGGICQPLGVHEYLYLFNSLPGRLRAGDVRKAGVNGVSVGYEPVWPEKLQAAAYQGIYDSCQFFFHPEKGMFDTHAAYIDFPMQELIPLLGREKELEEFLLSYENSLSHVGQAMEIYNYIFQQLQIDLEIYSYRQLLSLFGTYREMTEEIIRVIRQEYEKENWQGEGYSRGFLKIIKYIHENFRSNISTREIADSFHLNPSYVSQLFKKETGNTLVRYMNSLRIQEAEKLLSGTELSVEAIGSACGFNDYFYFLKTFKKYKGCSPSQYRKEQDPASDDDSETGEEET